jgi:hypothetical protein
VTAARVAIALAVLAACRSEAAAPVAVVETAPPWQVRGPGGLEPIEPGTRDPALLRASACAACHPAEHAEWAASRHGKAWTNGIFQREYRDLPRRWCVHCHAPLTPQVAEVAAGGVAPLADDGVSCAVCHVRDGRLIARRKGASSPHDTAVRADFGSAAFCADCHQFSFPRFGSDREPVGLSSFPMQDTVAQFQRGPFGAASHGCLDCHGSASSHAFPGAHDPGMLAAAIRHGLCRDRDHLVLSLRNAGAGHNVPTGDVHRHIEVRLWRPSAPEALVEIFVGRRFEPADDGGKRTIWDSTLPPATTRTWRLAVDRFAGEADEPILVELRYVYTADEVPRAHRDPGEPTSVVFGEGRHDLAALPRCPDL